MAESQALSPELADVVESQIRAPEDRSHGDLALPCFALAGPLKQNPKALAEKVASALSGDRRWEKVEAVGPYVNVTFSAALLAEGVMDAARGPGYGEWTLGAGRSVAVDFSSPNIAKPLAFHHIRSTVIGAAVCRLHQALGYEVHGINYLGDWGKQFGLLATGFQRHGDPTKRADARHLVEVYVKTNKEADVGGLKATIAAPEAAKKSVAALKEARVKLETETDAKAKKKLKKSISSGARKLNGQRGLPADADPTEDTDDWYAALEAEAEKAKGLLPQAEAYDAEARQFFRRMEEKDPAAIAEWQEFRQTSIEGFQKVYDRMGVEFSSIEGESKYQDVLEETVARVREKPGTEISDGAEIVATPPPKGEPPVLLKTRDGTTLYVTRDLAAAIDRHQRFDFARSLYVVAQDQALHFRQLYRTLAEMGFDWAAKCEHIAFGRVHGMSTRKGNIVYLDDVLNDAVAKAREICEQSEKIAPEHLDEAVEAIGIGAIVFGDLRSLRASDYTFAYEDVLNFSGHTGPYVQFSHARACSILRKAGDFPKQADPTLLTLPQERTVLIALARYPDVVRRAAEECEPSYLTGHLIEVARSTASWLTAGNQDRSKRVLLEDNDALRSARLYLIDAVRNVLAHGLAILGIKAPEAM